MTKSCNYKVTTQDIATTLQVFPQTSTTSLAMSYDINFRSLRRILKREKYHRIEFCARMTEVCDNDQCSAYTIYCFPTKLRFVSVVCSIALILSL